MNSRRNLLKTAGLTAAALAVSGSSSRKSIAAFAQGQDDGAPWWLLSPLQQGASLGRGWSIDALSPIESGAAILTLAHRDGRQARVHMCAWKDAPRGVAHTELLDLIIMDGGQGDRPTEEGLGRALSSLASRIRRNELRIDADIRALAGMQSHEERVEQYGAESLV